MIEISCKQFRYLASPPYFFRLRHVALWPAFFFRLCHVALWAAIFDSNPSVNWLHPVGRGRKREVLQLFPTVLGAVTNCLIFVPNCFCCCSQLFLQLFPTIFAVVPNSFCCCPQLFLLLFPTVFAIVPNCFWCPLRGTKTVDFKSLKLRDLIVGWKMFPSVYDRVDQIAYSRLLPPGAEEHDVPKNPCPF